MFNKGLANSRLRFMADIWNTENHTFRNLTHFFPVTSDLYKSQFLNWLTLKKSIPNEWFNVDVKSNESDYDKSNVIIINNSIVAINKLTSNSIYNHFISLSITNSVSECKLKQNYTSLEWPQVCSAIYSSSIDTYSRQFRFRILHNYLTVNDLLYKWKLVDTNKCSYCHTEAETLVHLFCDCAVPRTLYYQIKSWLENMNVKMPDLTVSFILYGATSEKCKNIKLIQHINNLYKQFVFQCRGETELHFKQFRHRLNIIENVEGIVAKNKNKVDVHLKKWGPIKIYLESEL